MKVLLTVHQFFPQFAAGTEVLTYSVARDLVRRGHDVRVMTGHPAGAELREEDRFDEYEFDGIHVYRFHHAYAPMAGQTSKIELDFDNRLAAKYFGKVLEDFRPDVVHFFHLNRLGTRLIECAVQANIPCFMTPTDFWAVCPTGQLVYGNGRFCSGPSAFSGNCVKHLAQSRHKGLVGRIAGWLPTRLVGLLARFTLNGLLPPYPNREEVTAVASRLDCNISRLNQLNGLIVPSSFMRELLIHHGVFPHLIIQSAFGIDFPSDEGGTRRSITRQPLRIGFIGTPAPHKGCHVLIEAFKALPLGLAVLKIYGNMEPSSAYSRTLKSLAGNSDAIEFCGTFHNSRIGEVLAGIDVLVVPSLWFENTPLVVYSAQAADCPVVASNTIGISEVIRDDVNGLLFDPGNAAALAKKLSRFIDEPGLAARLSSSAQHPKATASYVDSLLGIWAAA
jgi:glycosyltransferase involved in cell wall biosynthesis